MKNGNLETVRDTLSRYKIQPLNGNNQIRTKNFSRDGTEFTKVSRTAVLLQSGLDETWWADSMKCYRYLQNVQEFLSSSETPYERRFGDPFNKWAHNSLRMIEYHPLSAQDQSRLLQFCLKSSSDTHCMREEFGKETFWSQMLTSWKTSV